MKTEREGKISDFVEYNRPVKTNRTTCSGMEAIDVVKFSHLHNEISVRLYSFITETV